MPGNVDSMRRATNRDVIRRNSGRSTPVTNAQTLGTTTNSNAANRNHGRNGIAKSVRLTRANNTKPKPSVTPRPVNVHADRSNCRVERMIRCSTLISGTSR